MRKGFWIGVFLLGVGVAFATSAFSEEMQGMENEPQDPGMMMGMGGQGGPGKGKMMGMMGMMHKDSVVATSDGGVVVLSGPRLLKYDNQLTLVKEVEIPRGKKPGPAQEPAEIPIAPEEAESPAADPAAAF